MKVIGFGHLDGVGKSTAARFLNTYLRLNTRNQNIVCASFAYKLKSVCYDLYGWAGLEAPEYYENHPEWKNIVLPEIGRSPRDIWIKFGSQVCREIYDYTWIDYLFKVQHKFADVIIIPDVRFVNEADRVLDHYNGHLIRINNINIPYVENYASKQLINYDRWTKTINNDSTLGDLQKKIIKLAHELELL